MDMSTPSNSYYLLATVIHDISIYELPSRSSAASPQFQLPQHVSGTHQHYSRSSMSPVSPSSSRRSSVHEIQPVQQVEVVQYTKVRRAKFLTKHDAYHFSCQFFLHHFEDLPYPLIVAATYESCVLWAISVSSSQYFLVWCQIVTYLEWCLE